MRFVVISLVLLTLSLLSVAAWSDLSSRTIPNWISLLLAVNGFALQAHHGAFAVLESLVVAIALFAPLVLLHARGAMGGGDVKLLTALALGLPPAGIYRLVIATALAGGAQALLYLILRTLPSPRRSSRQQCAARRVLTAERWRSQRHGSLPYGVAIACGGAWALFPNLAIGG